MKLKEIEEMSDADRVEISKIKPGDVFVCTVNKIETYTDEYSRQCLKVELLTEDEKLITQKYTPMHMRTLVTALETLQVEDFDVGQKYRFEAQHFRIGYPRLIPVGVIE